MAAAIHLARRISTWNTPSVFVMETSSLPVLDVHVDWAYGGQWNHLWGTYTYNGVGVHGFAATPAGVPLDSFGRNLYVDTYNSAYGPGWRRENSALTHTQTGVFCYSVNPHGSRPAGRGIRYRITVIGPGVTPDVRWEGASPGAYSPAADHRENARIAALGDRLCRPT